jgi:hypothetical protein
MDTCHERQADIHSHRYIKIKTYIHNHRDMHRQKQTHTHIGTRTGPDRYTQKHIGRHKYKHETHKQKHKEITAYTHRQTQTH